jgi:hypothetical protein
MRSRLAAIPILMEIVGQGPTAYHRGEPGDQDVIANGQFSGWSNRDRSDKSPRKLGGGVRGVGTDSPDRLECQVRTYWIDSRIAGCGNSGTLPTR